MKACLLRPGSPPLGLSLNDAEQRNPQGRAQKRRGPVIADVEVVEKPFFASLASARNRAGAIARHATK